MNEKIFRIQLAKLNKPAIWVAYELGIDPSVVSRWVRGWTNVPNDIKPKLAEILEVPQDHLFNKESTDD